MTIINRNFHAVCLSVCLSHLCVCHGVLVVVYVHLLATTAEPDVTRLTDLVVRYLYLT